MDFQTADLCDEHSEHLQIASLYWQSYGKSSQFSGRVRTVKCYEDNSKIKQLLQTPGNSQILVVDAGGSSRCAMFGDMLAQFAIDNNWAGIVIYGMIRDSKIINKLDIGVKALGTYPLKSDKKNIGDIDVNLHFANMKIETGDYLYSDEDGIIVSKTKLI